MNFTYFHGTSSLFLKSIKENGLGTINPTFNNHTLELLKFLYGICENKLIDCCEYDLLTREVTLAMIRQTTLISNNNGVEKKMYLRHGNIYVSLSEIKAVIHSVLNEFGSEIIQQCSKLYNLLLRHNINFEIPNEINYYKIEQIDKNTLFPILIKIKNIDDNNLLKENDLTCADEFLNELRKLMPILTEERKYREFQALNFEILNPISSEYLDFYRIDYVGNVKDRTLSYNLKSIKL